MNVLDKWADRIYSENDFGRNVATSAAGIIGLAMYLATSDWVIAAFSSIISFPIVRLLAASYHQRIKSVVERREQEKEAKETYRRLSAEERTVIGAFVASGGSVMTWTQVNNSDIARSAIESLIQRELLSTSVTADGMRETFVLSSQLFDVGLKNATHDVPRATG